MTKKLDELQYVYLDFDGEDTVYRNADLDLEIGVSVSDSGIVGERREEIVTQLNERYADTGVVFVSVRPTDVMYSTVYIGTTDSFAGYGDYLGLAEAIDKGNEVKDDNAFVMADWNWANDDIVSVIEHEIGHIVYGEEHALKIGGEILADYATNNYYTISTARTYSSQFVQAYYNSRMGSDQDVTYWTIEVPAGQVATVTITCNSSQISYASGYFRIVTSNGDDDAIYSTGNSKTYLIPYGSRIKILDGAVLEAGDELTEGSVNPHDILRIKGVRAVQDYMLREVQRVYRLQGVEINDKHVEIIVRQMLKKVRVETNGNTEFLPGSMVDILEFEDENARVLAEGGTPAEGKQVMLGITKASLATNSFMSAASFQETTKVLTEAAIHGKIDPLIGLKENVIIGKLIPAGTGMKRYRNVKLDSDVQQSYGDDEYGNMEEIGIDGNGFDEQ